ncbi:hypothetical protein F4824DRAFT_446847, partial [Ustulina deusta]
MSLLTPKGLLPLLKTRRFQTSKDTVIVPPGKYLKGHLRKPGMEKSRVLGRSRQNPASDSFSFGIVVMMKSLRPCNIISPINC